MNLKIIRKSILITIIIFPQYLVSVKSSNLNEIQFNDVSNQLLISGWKPSSDKNRKDKKARGYAVFPNVGKGGIGIGGARGKGEVFEKGKVIGSTTLTQVSIGFQLGGQAFSQIIFFKDKKSLERFTEGNFEFGASASAALISEGANASADYSDGVAVLTFSKGGLMYEASIGGQKFSYEEY